MEILAGSGNDDVAAGVTTAATTLRLGGGPDVVVIANNGGLNGGWLDGGGGVDTLDLALWTAPIVFEAAAARALYLGRASGAQMPGPLSSSGASGHVVATLDPATTALALRAT